IPASRSARAMIFAPRSCPSSPGLATTTRILRSLAPLSAAFSAVASTAAKSTRPPPAKHPAATWSTESFSRPLSRVGAEVGQRADQRNQDDQQSDRHQQPDQGQERGPHAPGLVVDVVHRALVHRHVHLVRLLLDAAQAGGLLGVLAGGVVRQRLLLVALLDVPTVDLVRYDLELDGRFLVRARSHAPGSGLPACGGRKHPPAGGMRTA